MLRRRKGFARSGARLKLSTAQKAPSRVYEYSRHVRKRRRTKKEEEKERKRSQKATSEFLIQVGPPRRLREWRGLFAQNQRRLRRHSARDHLQTRARKRRVRETLFGIERATVFENGRASVSSTIFFSFFFFRGFFSPSRPGSGFSKECRRYCWRPP